MISARPRRKRLRQPSMKTLSNLCRESSCRRSGTGFTSCRRQSRASLVAMDIRSAMRAALCLHCPCRGECSPVRSLIWHRPLIIGWTVRRDAVICKIDTKSGRSGALKLVTVAYRYYQKKTTSTAYLPKDDQERAVDSDLCIEEEQDIVYREPGPPLPPPQPVKMPVVPDGAWSRTIVPDTRLLFRFSALTFNAHRIHYDRPYATGEEGYPGLVVHGPLTAMLLLNLVRENTPRAVASYRFRSQATSTTWRQFGSLPRRQMAASNCKQRGRTRSPR